MLFDLLKHTAERLPEKTATVFEGDRMSYSELCLRVEGLAKGLSSLGVQHGDCIALIMPNCPEFIISFFAALKLHAVILPINPASVLEEIKYYISDSDAVSIITDRARSELCRAAISALEKNIKLIVTDDEVTPDIVFSDLIKTGEIVNINCTSDDEDAVYQYSSGSTGRPKRVCKTQKNLYQEAENFHLTVNTTDTDNILCVVPLFHAHGLGNCMLASIYTGSTLVILEDFRVDGKPVVVTFVFRRKRVLELIEKEKVTILPGVPFVFSALADTPIDKVVDLSSLRLCFSAGNFLPKKVFDKFMKRFNKPIRQLYGCTEVGSFSINMDTDRDFHFDSVGHPMKNNQAIIIDEEGNTLPEEVIGEIAIKSGALTSGYCNRPDLNKEAFKDGYFLTGDLGRRDMQGRLFITGRKKIFIEIAGNKVDPLEVEDVLITHPKVKEVVVVGIKGANDEEAIKAVIVPESDCRKQEIQSYCKNKLTSFKIPQIIEFREEIPKSPLGKILRKDLI